MFVINGHTLVDSNLKENRIDELVDTIDYSLNTRVWVESEQRTLTVGESITAWLVSSVTSVKLTNEGNIILSEQNRTSSLRFER